MNLLSIVLILAVAGLFLWLVNQPFTPIDGKIKKVINIVVILAVCWWLLKVFGILNYLRGIVV